MKRVCPLLVALLAAGTIGAGSAAAQSGFALKAHYLLNATTADEARDSLAVPHADGFGLGAEVVLPFGLGLGISGYTAGETSDLDLKTTEFTVLGEANYFLRLPFLPISPYAGVHAGLGMLNRDNVSDPSLEIHDKTRSQLGYQFGLRFQPTALLGFDAQWRHMSTSADEGQSDRLERNQVLLGITLF